MRVLAVRSISVGTISSSSETLLRRRKSRWTTGLFVSSVSALLAGIIGLTFGALSLAHVIDISSPLQTIGTLLIAAAFPLLAVVAHCLDKIESLDRRIRVERCLRYVQGDVIQKPENGG